MAVLDDIEADMGLNTYSVYNPYSKGATWTVSGSIEMGNAMRGDAPLAGWAPSNPAYRADLSWTAITPWWVIWPATTHPAVLCENVRIKIHSMKTYLKLISTGDWVKLDCGTGRGWSKVMNFQTNSSSSLDLIDPTRLDSDGTYSHLLPVLDFVPPLTGVTIKAAYPVHGGQGQFDLVALGITPSDISCVYTELKSSLTLTDPAGPDNRASCLIGVEVGTDFYPDANTGVGAFTPTAYAPASGSSRFSLVTSAERTHYYTSVAWPGINIKSTPYTQGGGISTITKSAFLAAPPPHLADVTAPGAPGAITYASHASETIGSTTYPASRYNFSWVPGTDNLSVRGYKVLRNGTQVGVTITPDFKDRISNSVVGQPTTYTIKTVDDNGNESNANTSSVILLRLL